MWIKKNKTELWKEKQGRRFNPFPPLIYSLIPIVLDGFSILDFSEKEIMILMFSLFILSYLSQIFFLAPHGLLLLLYGSFSDKSYICNKCYKIVGNVKSLKCNCGGVLENLEEWKYVAD